MYYIIEGELSGATEKTFGAKAPDAQARRRHCYHPFLFSEWATSEAEIRRLKEEERVIIPPGDLLAHGIRSNCSVAASCPSPEEETLSYTPRLCCKPQYREPAGGRLHVSGINRVLSKHCAGSRDAIAGVLLSENTPCLV